MENVSELKTFNVVAAGYGGQGVLTLAKILARAAFMAGLDVRQSELHGLSQRGGSLTCHIRFGEEVYSPLVRAGGADLIIALEAAEALRACNFSDPEKTVVLSNAKLFSPAGLCSRGACPASEKGDACVAATEARATPAGTKDLNLEEILVEIGGYAKLVETTDADKIVRELTGETTSVNIFMLAWALGKDHLPLEEDIVWQAITETLRNRFWEANQKVFNTASKM